MNEQPFEEIEMMKHTRGLYMLIIALLVRLAAAEEVEKQEATAAPEETAPVPVAELAEPETDWLDSIWTQVDELTVEKDFELQETVTTSGVRGAEARNAILDKLYYRGGRQTFPGLTEEEGGTGDEGNPDAVPAKSEKSDRPEEPVIQ